MAAALPPAATTSAPASILSNRPYAESLAASASDSGSTRSLSVHSRERNLVGGVFGRRGSAAGGMVRPGSKAKSMTSSSNRSYRSNKSNRSSSIHDTASGEQMFEMTAVTLRAGGKKRVHEDPSTRVDRRKAEAAMQKWRVSSVGFLSAGPRHGRQLTRAPEMDRRAAYSTQPGGH